MKSKNESIEETIIGEIMNDLWDRKIILADDKDLDTIAETYKSMPEYLFLPTGNKVKGIPLNSTQFMLIHVEDCGSVTIRMEETTKIMPLTETAKDLFCENTKK